MSGDTDGMDDGRLDLVPMIDCIMLLLLFFMMTTKFTAEEKAISSILPTDKGQGGTPQEKKDPPQTVNIVIYPEGMTKGYQPSDYAAQLNKMRKPGDVLTNAYLRIGGREPILMPGRSLNQAAGLEMQKQVDIIHAYVAEELAKFEKPGEPRDKQNDIIVHCFSGLSWKFALVTYDAVRSYEATVGNLKYTGNPEELIHARAVTFAPPRVRDYTANELGNELYEIIHTK
jgi:Biopolymer transport protein ExbD/TolR